VVNDLIRQALYPYPENLKLVTKVGARRDAAGRVLAAQRPDELRKGVEANLHTLRVGRLDLVNLRLVETARDDGVPLEEQLLALADMRAEGKLDLIGLSNADAAKAELALRFVDVAEIQNGYSIIDRRDEDTFDLPARTESRTCRSLPLARRTGPGRGGWPQTPRSSRSPTSTRLDRVGRSPDRARGARAER
jgi:aryl-alcohol dehydrogenase-like predicted oxidoreductase